MLSKSKKKASNDMMKLINIKDGVFMDRRINITRYTKEVAFKSYPEYSEDEVNALVSRDEEEILLLAEESLGEEIKNVTWVVLDEEFLEWLEDNDKINNPNIRAEYANALSYDDVKRLWEKNNFHINYNIYNLPALVKEDGLNNKTYNVSKASQQVIERAMQNKSGIDSEVWVNDILLHGENYDREMFEGDLYHRFASKLDSYFEEGRDFSINPTCEDQDIFIDTNFNILFLLFVLKEVNGPTMNREKIIARENDILSLDSILEVDDLMKDEYNELITFMPYASTDSSLIERKLNIIEDIIESVE